MEHKEVAREMAEISEEMIKMCLKENANPEMLLEIYKLKIKELQYRKNYVPPAIPLQLKTYTSNQV